MRRFLLLLAVITTATAITVTDLAAQYIVGAHVSQAQDVFGGTKGFGLDGGISLPLLPIDIVLSAEYFFPDCGTGGSCSFWGGSADVNYRFLIPVIRPFIQGSVISRRLDWGDGYDPIWYKGIGVGAGIDVSTTLIRLYGVARYEFMSYEDQIVVRFGIFR